MPRSKWWRTVTCKLQMVLCTTRRGALKFFKLRQTRRESEGGQDEMEAIMRCETRDRYAKRLTTWQWVVLQLPYARGL
ncbi:hypothetical protein J6590_060428 [Homalodisca vitripennis]|nr:hypothetical protein J6590_060428 [Homalodisca vitripennis]